MPETNREKVKELYGKAKTIEGKLNVLKEWHPEIMSGLRAPAMKTLPEANASRLL
ncbi:MAG: hypothetical protein V1736_11730 [Pseudomonadota bacterium]